MPFNQPRRNDSWPPSLLRLSADDEELKDQGNDSETLQLHSPSKTEVEEEQENLEENPFSYFLSSPESSDDDEDLSAGIDSGTDTTPIIRTVSPSDFQIRDRDTEEPPLSPVSSEEDYIYDPEFFDSDAFDISTAVPLTLREFSARQRTRSLSPFSSVTRKPISKLSGPGPITSHIRGRNPSLHGTSTSSRRLRADTHPVRRPHSWRRPSDDVWTIPEESSSSASGSNSSKESLQSSPRKEDSSSGSENKSQTSSNQATLKGDDTTQHAVWERDGRSKASRNSEGRKLSSSPISQQSRDEEDERLLALATVTVLEEAPYPTEPVLRLPLPLRRRKTVRFDLPELE